MSKRIINAQVFKSDTYESWRFDGRAILPYEPVSADLLVEGVEYFNPVVERGVVTGYERSHDAEDVVATTATTVRLRNQDTGQVIWILGTVANWATRVNECCDGAAGDMPQITLQLANLTDEPCPTEVVADPAISYDYFAVHSTPIIVGQKLTVVGQNNGVSFTPAAPGAGFATVAAALTWVQANWGAYGTFTAEGTTGIKMVSTSVKKGRFELALQDVLFCMTISAAQVFNQVKNGNTTFDQGGSVTVVDATQVIAAIKGNFADGTLTAFSATKILYTGKNVPGGILLNGVSVAAFSAGACA